MSGRKKRKYTKRSAYWTQEQTPPGEQEETAPLKSKAQETRDFLRKQAGWPALN